MSGPRSGVAEPLGWLPIFDPQLGQALAMAAALVRDSEALATLLEAAGAEAVDQVDRIFRRRLGERLAAEIVAGTDFSTLGQDKVSARRNAQV